MSSLSPPTMSAASKGIGKASLLGGQHPRATQATPLADRETGKGFEHASKEAESRHALIQEQHVHHNKTDNQSVKTSGTETAALHAKQSANAQTVKRRGKSEETAEGALNPETVAFRTEVIVHVSSMVAGESGGAGGLQAKAEKAAVLASRRQGKTSDLHLMPANEQHFHTPPKLAAAENGKSAMIAALDLPHPISGQEDRQEKAQTPDNTKQNVKTQRKLISNEIRESSLKSLSSISVISPEAKAADSTKTTQPGLARAEATITQALAGMTYREGALAGLSEPSDKLRPEAPIAGTLAATPPAAPADVRHLTLRFSPEHLGHLDMTIAVKDAEIEVHITSHSSHALELIKGDERLIERALLDAGYEPTHVKVTLASEMAHGTGQDGFNTADSGRDGNRQMMEMGSSLTEDDARHSSNPNSSNSTSHKAQDNEQDVSPLSLRRGQSGIYL